MTPDEARELIIEGMNYAAYRETDSSLYALYTSLRCFFARPGLKPPYICR